MARNGLLKIIRSAAKPFVGAFIPEITALEAITLSPRR
jgi:hypothetical protein